MIRLSIILLSLGILLPLLPLNIEMNVRNYPFLGFGSIQRMNQTEPKGNVN